MNMIGFKVSHVLNSLRGETGQKCNYLYDELVCVKTVISG